VHCCPEDERPESWKNEYNRVYLQYRSPRITVIRKIKPSYPAREIHSLITAEDEVGVKTAPQPARSRKAALSSVSREVSVRTRQVTVNTVTEHHAIPRIMPHRGLLFQSAHVRRAKTRPPQRINTRARDKNMYIDTAQDSCDTGFPNCTNTKTGRARKAVYLIQRKSTFP